MEATDLVLSDRVLGPTTKSSQPCSSTSRVRHRLVLARAHTLSAFRTREATLQSWDPAKLVPYCPHLRRLWVLDIVEDKRLKAVRSNCHLIEELRVFPSSPNGDDVVDGVTESGFVAMTNATVVTVAQNCHDITHFRLCIMTPTKPDHLKGEPMDEAFSAVMKICTKLDKLKHGKHLQQQQLGSSGGEMTYQVRHR
ncbi:hypothetical protein ACFX11_028014 [Malus domestica]